MMILENHVLKLLNEFLEIILFYLIDYFYYYFHDFIFFHQ